MVGLRVEADISPKKIKAEYFEQQQQKETLRWTRNGGQQTTTNANALAAKRFVIHVMPATLINGFALLRGNTYGS